MKNNILNNISKWSQKLFSRKNIFIVSFFLTKKNDEKIRETKIKWNQLTCYETDKTAENGVLKLSLKSKSQLKFQCNLLVG